MEFALNEEQQMIVKATRDFVREELMPHEQEVETAGEAFQSSFPLCVVHELSAKFPDLGFLLLVIAGGERVNLTTPFVGKLQRHVPKAANANDPDPGRG